MRTFWNQRHTQRPIIHLPIPDRIPKALVGIIVTLCAAACTMGCSVVGHIAGSAIDHGGAGERNNPPQTALKELEPGDAVQCLMKDGSKLTGIYEGHGPLRSDVSVPSLAVNPCAESASRARVLPGDRLILTRKGRGTDTVVYVSAEKGRLCYRAAEETGHQYLQFEFVESLSRCDGTRIRLPLTQRFTEGLFSTPLRLHLRTDDAVLPVDTADVAALQYEYYPTDARTLLTVLGLLVDVVAIVGILTFDMDFNFGSSSTR